MPIYHGLTQVNKKEIIHNAKQMGKVYVGDKLVWQKPTDLFSVRFGFMYPYYVVPTTSHASLIALGWDFITATSWNAIAAVAAGYPSNIGSIKSTNTDHWTLPNNVTNELLLNIRGSGAYTAGWSNIRNIGYIRGRSTTSIYDWFLTIGKQSTTGSIAEANNATWKNYLFPIIACRSAVGKPNGQTGIYIGNDGKKYPTIVINQWEITSFPLCETKFTDGTNIPYAGSDSAINTFNSSSSPYYSYYNFIESNAYPLV